MPQDRDVPKIPAELKVLITATFLIAIGFGIVAPILPLYAESFGVGAFAVSAVVSSFGLARLLFAPVSGKVTSRFGEPYVYTTGVTIVALSMFLVALAQTYPQLLIFRGLGGIGSTLFTVSAMSYLARKSPPTIRGRISGAYASSFLLGNIFGPIVGGALAGLGPRAPFIIYGCSLVVAASVVFFTLTGVGRSKTHRPAPDHRPAMKLRQALSNSSYRATLTSFFANGWAAFGVRNSVTPLFAASAFAGMAFFLDGPQTAAVGLSLFAVGNVIAVTFSSRLSDRIGRKPLIVSGLFIAGVTTGVLGVFVNPWLFLALNTIAGAGTGLLNAPQQAAIIDIVGQDKKAGTVMATAQMASDVGGIAGPLLVGLIVDVAGYAWGFGLTGVILVTAALVWTFSPETNVPITPGGPRTGSLPKIDPTQSEAKTMFRHDSDAG